MSHEVMIYSEVGHADGAAVATRSLTRRWGIPRAIEPWVEALRSERVWFSVAPLLLLVLVVALGRAWLEPGLPPGDLAGAAADLARWQTFVQSGELLAAWDATAFLGHPRSLVNLYSGMALAYAPLLLFFDPLMAVKVGCLTYLALAGYSAALLIRYVTRHTFVALLLGLAYALHPIHLSLTVASSHANFPPYYAVQPLVILACLRLLDHPSLRRASVLGLLAACAGWLDLERLAVLAPGLTVLSVVLIAVRMNTARGEVNARHWLREGERSVLALLAAAAITVSLLAVLWLPALVDKPLYALFDEEARSEAVSFFSIRNPLYYLDPLGNAMAPVYAHLPAEHAHDAGNFYLGWSLLALAGLALVLQPRYIPRRDVLGGLVLGVAATLAAAHGPYSGLASLGEVFQAIFLYADARVEAGPRMLTGMLLVATLIGVTVVVLPLLMRRAWRPWGWPLAAVGVAIVLLATPHTWLLRYVPILGDMRNPGWFATALPPLGLSLAAGIGLTALLRRIPYPSGRGLLVLLAITVLALDVWPYRQGFDKQLDAGQVQDLAVIGQFMRADPRPGRFLTRESYNPHTDLLYAYSGRSAAWYWLNWMATSRISDLFLNQIYPQLHRPETIDDALVWAGRAHVRFIVYDLTEGPPPPPSSALQAIWSGEYYALYENHACQPWARLEPPHPTGLQDHFPPPPPPPPEVPPEVSPEVVPEVLPPEAYPGSRPVNDPKEILDASPQAVQLATRSVVPSDLRIASLTRNRDTIQLRIQAEEPQALVLAESWAPRWSATVNGRQVELTCSPEGWMRLNLPGGESDVRLTYARGWSYPAGAVISLSTGMCLVGLWAGPWCRRGDRGPRQRARLSHPRANGSVRGDTP